MAQDSIKRLSFLFLAVVGSTALGESNPIPAGSASHENTLGASSTHDTTRSVGAAKSKNADEPATPDAVLTCQPSYLQQNPSSGLDQIPFLDPFHDGRVVPREPATISFAIFADKMKGEEWQPIRTSGVSTPAGMFFRQGQNNFGVNFGYAKDGKSVQVKLSHSVVNPKWYDNFRWSSVSKKYRSETFELSLPIKEHSKQFRLDSRYGSTQGFTLDCTIQQGK